MGTRPRSAEAVGTSTHHVSGRAARVTVRAVPMLPVWNHVMNAKLLLTAKEAAELLGLTPDQVRALGVPSVPLLGRGEGLRTHCRYSRQAVLAWVAALPTTPVMTVKRSGGAR